MYLVSPTLSSTSITLTKRICKYTTADQIPEEHIFSGQLTWKEQVLQLAITVNYVYILYK